MTPQKSRRPTRSLARSSASALIRRVVAYRQGDAGSSPAVVPVARRCKRLMPIRPQYKWLYPIDWPQLSAMIRFERAKSRCEECGRPHGRGIQHLGDGRWWDEEDQIWRNGRGRSLPRPAPLPHVAAEGDKRRRDTALRRRDKNPAKRRRQSQGL